MVERRGETSFYTAEDVTSCMSKVTPIQLHQTVVVNGVEITPFYAGHVLGAAMFRIAVGPHSVVYTGDFNTSSDHHLGEVESVYACASSVSNLCMSSLSTRPSVD